MEINLIIPAITTFIGIGIGYILKWDIEKRRLKYNNRKELIKNVRHHLTQQTEVISYEFCTTSLYSEIRPYLNKYIIKQLEIPNYKNVNEGNYRHDIKHQLLDELKRMEIKWDII